MIKPIKCYVVWCLVCQQTARHSSQRPHSPLTVTPTDWLGTDWLLFTRALLPPSTHSSPPIPSSLALLCQNWNSLDYYFILFYFIYLFYCILLIYLSNFSITGIFFSLQWIMEWQMLCFSPNYQVTSTSRQFKIKRIYNCIIPSHLSPRHIS